MENWVFYCHVFPLHCTLGEGGGQEGVVRLNEYNYSDINWELGIRLELELRLVIISYDVLLVLCRRNFRPTWKLNVTEPVAGNYYPVNSRMYMQVSIVLYCVEHFLLL